jgi:hypothetical protein
MDEERLVIAWMARVAAAPLPGAHIADAATIVWQAQLRRRAEDRRRALRPIEVMERIQLGAVTVTVAAVLAWSLPMLISLFRLARI